MSQTQPQRPVKKFQAGAVGASIWQRTVKQDGREVQQFSVSIQKRYREKKSGNWQDSDSFFPNDLPRVEMVVRKAFEWITLNASEDHGDVSA